jgi:hypothetical protein
VRAREIDGLELAAGEGRGLRDAHATGGNEVGFPLVFDDAPRGFGLPEVRDGARELASRLIGLLLAPSRERLEGILRPTHEPRPSIAHGSTAAHDDAMIRARVCDPVGPRWTRALVPLVGLALLVFGPLVPIWGEARGAAALLGIALLVVAIAARPRLRAREGVLEVTPGRVRVRAGLLSQRILATDVCAASSARTARGVALAIVRRDLPARPIVLEVDDTTRLEQVRDALRLGHFGFGEISWPTRRVLRDTMGFFASILLAAGWVGMAAAAAFGAAGVCLTLALAVIPLTGAWCLAVFLAGGSRPRIVLSPHAFTLFDGPLERMFDSPPDRRGAHAVGYADVLGATVSPGALRIETRHGPITVDARAMTYDERGHVAAQLVNAMLRAQGKGEAPPAVPSSLATLIPRDEAKRAWLERVDATAASLASGGDAYRGTPIDAAELRSALENPDAPDPVRAAAARILARVDPSEASACVARVLATERNATTRARIRIALEEDVEIAARQLDQLDRA